MRKIEVVDLLGTVTAITASLEENCFSLVIRTTGGLYKFSCFDPDFPEAWGADKAELMMLQEFAGMLNKNSQAIYIETLDTGCIVERFPRNHLYSIKCRSVSF